MKIFRKSAAFITAFLMLISQTLIPQNLFLKETYAASNYIMGSGNHWADEYIQSLYNRGLIKGDSDGSMNPDRDITRAEFAAILNRALSYDTKTSARLPFSDVKGTEWYSDDINIAYNAGYFMGESKNQSGALNNLTREQAVVLLARNIKLDEIIGQSEFSDDKDISYWSRGAVNAATAKNIISGYQDNTFRPSNNITRGEAAKLLYTAFGEIVNTPGVKSYGTVDGNMTISASGVDLKDTTINGDLYITKGVGLGFTNLENVTVLGEIIISGSGESNSAESSIKLRDCYAKKVIIDSSEPKPVSLKVEGVTTIDETLVKTSAYLEELTNGAGGYKDIMFDGVEDSELHLLGDFDKVTVKGPNTHFYLDSGSIVEWIMDEEAIDSDARIYEDTYVERAYIDVPTNITGEGDISYININSDGVKVQGLPDEIVIRPGSTANVYGREMTSKQAQEASDYPRILSKYPVVDEIGPTSATATYEVNKPGKLYWAVTLDDDGAPSTEEILKPTKVKEIIKYGTIQVNSKDIKEEFSNSLGGLKKNTDYILSAVLVDERDDESPKKKESFTTSDDTKPTFNSGYPKVKSNDNTTVDMYASTSKNCTLYWVALDKGSTKPTETELKKQKITGAAAKGTVKNIKKNTEVTFKATGLKEVASYDIYFLLDDGENQSTVYKYNATTLDKTAPEFLEGYPKLDKVAERTVDIKFSVNEISTVYYIALKKGAEFPPVTIVDPTKPPVTVDLSSEEAKQAVLTGNNAFKSGRTGAQANKEGKFTVSGLSAETQYDVYVVAQDKAGNTSSVSKLAAKTLDNIPPTVTQEFEDVIEGNPSATTEIRIVFSEEVLDRNTMKSFTTDILKEYKNIILYDMSSNKKTEVEIDFDKAKILDLDDTEGKTVISFPDDAIELNAGNSYQFEINKIVDTSNNRMNDKVLLPMFTTVAPLVELVKPLASPAEVDMSFEIYPQATNTNDNVLFDLVFESDTTIRFELYERELGGEQFTLVSMAGSETAPLVLAGEGISLHSITEGRNGITPTTLEFEPFNKLTEKEYAIKIVSVNGDGEQESWNSSIKITVKAVIGSKTNLNFLAAEPAGRFDLAIEQGVLQVDSFPRPFEMMVTFADRRTPAFLEGYPKIDGYVGDVFINPFVAATKECTLYYMVAPAGSVIVNPEPDSVPEVGENDPAIIVSEGYVTRPGSIDIITGKVKPALAVSGTVDITSPGSVYNFLVEGLEPNKGYDIFYVLKGAASDPSQVYYQRFVTSQITAPALSDLVVANKGADSFDIKLTVDKNCMLYWVVYDSNYFDPDDPDGLEVTPYMIKNASEDTSFIPAAFGTLNVTMTQQELNDKKKEVTISVKGLDRSGGVFYNFYVIGQSTIANIPTGLDSVIKSATKIILRDTTIPTVRVTTSFNPPYDDTTRLFSGTITITFTEDMYFVPNVGDEKQPLTFSNFRKNLNINPNDDIQVEEGSSPRSSFSVSDYKTVTNKANEPMLRYVVITFRNVALNSMMFFPHILMDDAGNIVGRMTLTLVRDATAGVSWKDTYDTK